MQMAPNVDTCNLACSYCWREPHSETLNKIDDDPYELFLQSVKAHRRLITGYGGNPKADPKKFAEAQNPKHVAISLNGEPTLYSRLGEFLEICHQHGVSTFLVTNGSLPKVIEKLDPLPTQLYVSVDAPNKKLFNSLCKPKFDSSAFEKLEQTLELLPSLDTRTVCRHTLIKNESLGYHEDYARLDNIADPDFIEAKGYVYVGNSQNNSVIASGNNPGSVTCTEKYDGTSWTEKADLALARSKVGGAGTATAALCIGGYRGPPTADRTAFVEQWNGSAWTEVADFNTARGERLGGAGTTTDALAFGGGTPTASAKTEHYNGTSWSEGGDLGAANTNMGGCGTGTSALQFGGNPASNDLNFEFL